MLLVFFGVLYFIFSIGFKLLLGTSAFIANFMIKKSNNTPVKSQDFIGTVSVDSIPNATNSALFVVSGSVLNFDSVVFYLNGNKVKQVVLSTSDNFSEEIGELEPGNNDFFVQTKNKNGKESKKSKIYQIIYKNQKPKLDIKEPQENYKTGKNEIIVKGETDKETYVRVNDYPVVVTSQGLFEYLVRLKEGENKFTVTAEDTAGNIESKTLTVVYQKDE